MKIYNESLCAACYFRTGANPPNKKVLIQLTERCNLRCKHCFVSSTLSGNILDFSDIQNKIIPGLVKSNVTKVTLTGGEPFVYPKLYEVIKLLFSSDIEVSVCTNATLITESFLNSIQDLKGKIHFNVSLDGFSPSSHGRFRGNEDPVLFSRIIDNITLLGMQKLLNGILVTPNNYSCMDDYERICKFANKCGAKYVLMNPLSKFGRGENSSELAFTDNEMLKLKSVIQKYSNNKLEVVFIRFPNDEKKPLSKCNAGEILYIFTNGDIAFCPYMAFAAKDKSSKYKYEDFIIGNILNSPFDLSKCLSNYRLPIGKTTYCENCTNDKCEKGCFAVRIANGYKLEDIDPLCPYKKTLQNEKLDV